MFYVLSYDVMNE